MNDSVPTVKIRHKDDPKKEVYTINFASFDEAKHELVQDATALPPLTPLTPKPINEPMLFGSSIQPSTWNLPDGSVLQLGTVVAEAHRRTGLSPTEWNGLPNDQREQLIANVVLEMVPPDFTVSPRRGDDGSFKYIIIDGEGKQVGADEFADEATAAAAIEALTGKKVA